MAVKLSGSLPMGRSHCGPSLNDLCFILSLVFGCEFLYTFHLLFSTTWFCIDWLVLLVLLSMSWRFNAATTAGGGDTESGEVCTCLWCRRYAKSRPQSDRGCFTAGKGDGLLSSKEPTCSKCKARQLPCQARMAIVKTTNHARPGRRLLPTVMVSWLILGAVSTPPQ